MTVSTAPSLKRIGYRARDVANAAMLSLPALQETHLLGLAGRDCRCFFLFRIRAGYSFLDQLI